MACLGMNEVTLSNKQAMVLRELLGEHWNMFVAHAEDFGMDESECNECYKALDGE